MAIILQNYNFISVFSCTARQIYVTCHVPTDEVRPLSTAVNRAKQFGVQFIDPIEIISCDTLGCDYYNPRHDVRLKIPEGAILPSERIIDIEFGVTMHGPFKLSDVRSVRRISPVVWLCVQQDGFSGFQKDVEITIPHFLHLCTEDADKYLRFLKADHQPDASGKEEYHLKPADGKAVFDRATHGTLLTKHFCWQCLTSSIYPDKYTKYCLIGGRSKRSLGTQDWQIIFVVCYLLQSCILVSLVKLWSHCYHLMCVYTVDRGTATGQGKQSAPS